MDELPTLADLVRWLPPRHRRALSWLRVEIVDGRAEARLSIHDYTPASTADLEREAARRGLGEGWSAAGVSRVPDVIRAIRPWAVEEQLDELARSGIVGALNIHARRVPGGWVITAKTHAASDAERLIWLQSLPNAMSGAPGGLLDPDERARLTANVERVAAQKAEAARRQAARARARRGPATPAAFPAHYPGFCPRSGRMYPAGTPIVKWHGRWVIAEPTE